MRRDVFIHNDSGGFSVIAAAAADEIIADDRANDERFVLEHKALLLMLYGDDALPVRIVVDEPLHADEEAQWLARVSAQIDAPDGRILVMGGFDPYVLSTWRDEHGPDEDGHGVAVAHAAPGSWRVDLYTHTGSMNGRVILTEGREEKAGAFFRRCHPGRAFPLWLAKMLEYSGEDDPGHEELWSDVAASRDDGRLVIDTEFASAIGFLIHVTRIEGEPPETNESIWFDWESGQRVPEVFPLGLPASVPDPELESFLDKILRRPKPEYVAPPAGELVSVLDAWSGEPAAPPSGGEVQLAPAQAFLLYWMAAFTSDASPRYELRVTTAGPWTPAPATPECAVTPRGDGSFAIGPPPNTGGWLSWWSARQAAERLADLPDGSQISLAMAKDPEEADDEREPDPAVGRALYRGSVRGGAWQIDEVSPRVSRAVLAEAVGFAREILERNRIAVRPGPERAAFDAAAQMYASMSGEIVWEGEWVRLAEPDERMLWMLATPVFRARFAAHWPCEPIEMGEDEDDDE